MIAPSRWAADTFGAFFPVAVDVIAHGAPGVWARAASTADRTAPPPPAGPVSAVLLPDDDVPTVAIVGAIGPDKGARRIEALTALARSRGANLRFVVIGYTDRQSGPWQSDDARLTVHGRYDANALPRLLDHYRAALVAYPSHGPETFSFTLSEVWAAGRAVVVPPIGALRERVAGTGAGFVLTDSEWRDDGAFLDRLIALLDSGAAEALRAAGVAARAQPQPTLDAMAVRTVAHYRAALSAALVRGLAAARAGAGPRCARLRAMVDAGPAARRGARRRQARRSPRRRTRRLAVATRDPAAGSGLGTRIANAALRRRHTALGRVLYRLAPERLVDALKAKLR